MTSNNCSNGLFNFFYLTWCIGWEVSLHMELNVLEPFFWKWIILYTINVGIHSYMTKKKTSITLFFLIICPIIQSFLHCNLILKCCWNIREKTKIWKSHGLKNQDRMLCILLELRILINLLRKFELNIFFWISALFNLYTNIVAFMKLYL